VGKTASQRDRWQHAVTLGARGAVAGGRAVLDAAEAAIGSSQDPGDRALLSLITSTRASWLRQSGWHGSALGPDGRAALIATTIHDDEPSPWRRAALGDALIGLAADNLGLGRFDASSDLLGRAWAEIGAEREPDEWLLDGRVVLRWHWVRAENALYRGDGEAGRRWAAEAVRLARGCPSPHHRIKTRLIAAAARAGDDPGGAAAEARAVVDEAAQAGLVPLQWAGWQLLGGVAPGRDADAGSADTADILRRRGFFPVAGFGPGAAAR